RGDARVGARATSGSQVHVVDARLPQPHGDHRVATAEQQVARVEAKTDLGELEHLLYLPLGLDVRAGLVMQGGLVAALAAAGERHCDAVGETLPALGVEAEAAIAVGLR